MLFHYDSTSSILTISNSFKSIPWLLAAFCWSCWIWLSVVNFGPTDLGTGWPRTLGWLTWPAGLGWFDLTWILGCRAGEAFGFCGLNCWLGVRIVDGLNWCPGEGVLNKPTEGCLAAWKVGPKLRSWPWLRLNGLGWACWLDTPTLNWFAFRLALGVLIWLPWVGVDALICDWSCVGVVERIWCCVGMLGRGDCWFMLDLIGGLDCGLCWKLYESIRGDILHFHKKFFRQMGQQYKTNNWAWLNAENKQKRRMDKYKVGLQLMMERNKLMMIIRMKQSFNAIYIRRYK